MKKIIAISAMISSACLLFAGCATLDREPSAVPALVDATIQQVTPEQAVEIAKAIIQLPSFQLLANSVMSDAALMKSLRDLWTNDLPEDTDDEMASTPAEVGEGIEGLSANGYIWKPIGENSKRLVIVMPFAYTGRLLTNSAALWQNGSQIESANYTGVGNGGREHYRFGRAGNWYSSGTQLRITDKAGVQWSWTVEKTGSRNENLAPEKVEQ